MQHSPVIHNGRFTFTPLPLTAVSACLPVISLCSAAMKLYLTAQAKLVKAITLFKDQIYLPAVKCC